MTDRTLEHARQMAAEDPAAMYDPNPIRPGFTEDWLPEQSQKVLAELAAGVADVDGLIVEIGSWEGRSTVILANASGRTVQAVDTWQGSPGEESETLAADRDVYAQFTVNVNTMTDGNVQAHRMDWRDYEPVEPIALLFIDGLHTRPEVYATIRKFLPHMAPGGVICGDDFHHVPVRQAVLDFFPNASWMATLWVERIIK